ncbi:MAG: hypothetical protein ACI9F2_000280 [Lysobacterales bacterium]
MAKILSERLILLKNTAHVWDVWDCFNTWNILTLVLQYFLSEQDYYENGEYLGGVVGLTVTT